MPGLNNPLRPDDDGRIRMPAFDGAMNKVGTSTMPKSADDKGAMKTAKPKGKKGDDSERKDKIILRVIKRMDRAISAESENRLAALDDRKFKSGSQWPAEVVAQRNIDKRPCLTINKLPTFIHQITNDQRQNRPAIKISPVGDRGDLSVAGMYSGMIRHIERDCAADIAYDTAFDDAVSMGWGYWRVLTEWESPDSFDLKLVISRVRNPFRVYMDPAAQDPTGADAKWAFISDMIPRSEFEEKYPDAAPMPFAQSGTGENMKSWMTKDEIRIAEYFEIEYETRTLVQLNNGHVGWKDELDDITNAKLKRGTIEVEDEREARVPKVMWYKVTATEVLMEREWYGTSIPVVRVVGEEIDIEGKVKYSGVIRNAKDAQRMYNYWATAETELIALAPKAPWLLEEGQVEGHEDEFKMANTRSFPYLSYKGTSINGTPAPPPQRQQFAGVPAGVVQAKEGSAQDMQATTGVRFDATMNERMIDESGKAIRELRRTGDLGSFHYVDNLARALRRTGEILVEIIPLLYGKARTVTILREDDKEEQVRIDPNMPKPSGEMKKPDGKTMKMFNPTFGKYGVTVTIGPSYATKRIEASENMMNFVKALPQTGALIADLVAANQDWPGAEQIAARLAKTLPPGMLAPEMKDVPPQIQALLGQQDMQVKKLTQELQQAMKQLTDQGADRALAQDKIEKDFEAKLLKIVSDTETKMAGVQEKASSNFNTHIAHQLNELGTGVTTLLHAVEGAHAEAAEGPPANENQDAGGQGAAGQAAQPEPTEPPPPPEAQRRLMPGRISHFANGQGWTMGPDGKPLRKK